MESREAPSDYVVLLIATGQGPIQARVPELEGCMAEGNTREEALQNARAAIRDHLRTGAAPRKPVSLETVTVNVPPRRKA